MLVFQHLCFAGVKSLKLKGTKKEECDSGVSAEDQVENDKQNVVFGFWFLVFLNLSGLELQIKLSLCTACPSVGLLF